MRILFKSVSLIYKCAPGTFVMIVLVITLLSIIPSMYILITKYIIDSLVSLGGVSTDRVVIERIFYALAAWGGLHFISNIAGIADNLLQGDLSDKVVDYINRLIINKSLEMKDLYNFEDPAYYDDLSILKSQSGVRPVNLVANLSVNLKNTITVTSMILVLFSIDYIIPVVLLLSLVPHLYVTGKFNNGSWLAVLKTGTDGRRMNYFSTLMLSKDHIKEIQLFNTGKFFLKKYIDAFIRVYKEKNRLRKRQALLSLPTLAVNVAGNILILYIIIKNIMLGHYTYGTIAAFVQVLSQINFYLIDSNTVRYILNIHSFLFC